MLVGAIANRTPVERSAICVYLEQSISVSMRDQGDKASESSTRQLHSVATPNYRAVEAVHSAELRVRNANPSAAGQSAPLAVLLVGIDNHSQIAAQLGEPEYEQLLVAIARRIETSVRPEDVSYRLDSKQFVVVLTAITAAASGPTLVDQLRQRVRRRHYCGGVEVLLTTSIGLAFYGAGATTYPSLLKRAGIARRADQQQNQLRAERLAALLV